MIALAAGIAYVAYNYDSLSEKWNSMPEWVRYTFFAVTATLELVGAMVRFSRNAESFESASRAAFGGLPEWAKTGLAAFAPFIHMRPRWPQTGPN